VEDRSFFHRPITPLKRQLDFRGRTRRADYWPYMSLLLAIYVSGFAFTPAGGLSGIGSLIAPICGLTLVLILLALAATARRLHDVGWSGRWMAAYAIMAIAFIAFFFFYWRYGVVHRPHVYTGAPPFLRLMPLVMLFSLAMNCTAFLVFILSLLDGTPGPNKYGPDPKGRSAS
jgi:uncharacterized membrane protein YhaH (DUF805 family)